MLPKPTYLGPEFAEQFCDPSVVAAYRHRPPYPAAVFDILTGLVVPPGTVLDASTGTGEITRALAERKITVDAVDPSSEMLSEARRMPGGERPNIDWILGCAERVPLRPYYGLVVAAASLHWMDWPIVLPRFRGVLAPGAVVAIVEDRALPNPWDEGLKDVIRHYSTNREFQPFDLEEELTKRNLFREIRREQTQFVAFRQDLDDFVESFHARNGFSRDRMLHADATAFDREVAILVIPHLVEGQVSLMLGAEVIWGIPIPA